MIIALVTDGAGRRRVAVYVDGKSVAEVPPKAKRRNKSMRGITFTASDLTDESIADLYDAWGDLAKNAIEKNVFLFPWFIRASIPLLQAKRPLLVAVYQDRLLIGLTLMQTDKGYAKLPVNFFRNCFHYHQFLATPLIREGHSREFFIGLGSWLDASSGNQSFCLLNLFSGDGEIAKAADTVFGSEDRDTALLDQFVRAAIIGPAIADASGDIHISKNRLKNLRRRRNQLSKLGNVSVECFAADDSAEEWLEGFIRLENSGWKNKAKTSIAQNPIDLAFYREMIASAAEEKALLFMRLTVDGRPIAYTLDLFSDPFIYCVKSAHDPEYRKYAPGVILEHETLKKYRRPDGHLRTVDSCTSPENEMLNELWPDKRAITALAFARAGLQHKLAFKSVLLLKTLVGKSGTLKRAGK